MRNLLQFLTVTQLLHPDTFRKVFHPSLSSKRWQTTENIRNMFSPMLVEKKQVFRKWNQFLFMFKWNQLGPASIAWLLGEEGVYSLCSSHLCLPDPLHSVHCVHSLTGGLQSVHQFSTNLKFTFALYNVTESHEIVNMLKCNTIQCFFQIKTSAEQNFTLKSSSHSFTLKQHKVFLRRWLVECIIVRPFRRCRN